MEQQIKEWVREHCPGVTSCEVVPYEHEIEEPYYKLRLELTGCKHAVHYWVPRGLLERRGLDHVMIDTLQHEIIPAIDTPEEPERSIRLWLHSRYRNCVVLSVLREHGRCVVLFRPSQDAEPTTIYIEDGAIAEHGLSKAMRLACNS